MGETPFNLLQILTALPALISTRQMRNIAVRGTLAFSGAETFGLLRALVLRLLLEKGLNCPNEETWRWVYVGDLFSPWSVGPQLAQRTEAEEIVVLETLVDCAILLTLYLWLCVWGSELIHSTIYSGTLNKLCFSSQAGCVLSEPNIWLSPQADFSSGCNDSGTNRENRKGPLCGNHDGACMEGIPLKIFKTVSLRWSR